MGERIRSKLEILSAFATLELRIAPLLLKSDLETSSGKLTLAVDSYRQLIALLSQQLEVAEGHNRDYPDTPFELSSIVNQLLNAQLTLADVFDSLGDFKLAEDLRNAASRLSEEYLSPFDAAERHRQRAQSLLAQSRYTEALVALHDTLDMFRSRGDALQVASVTRNIAEVLEWLGDYNRALAETRVAAEAIEAILEGREPSNDAVGEALRSGEWKRAENEAKLLQVWLDLEQILARICRRLGDSDQAEAHFRKILPKVPRTALPALEFQLAVILIERGNFEEGLLELTRLEPLFTGLMRPKIGVVQSWRAEALLALGRVQEAVALARAAVQELSAYRDEDSLWKALWRLARALCRNGEEREALTTYLEAARAVDGLRKSPLGYRLDSTYMADKLPLFEQAISLASRLDDADKGCTLMELVKSRALSATLTLPSTGESRADGQLELQVDALSRQMEALEYSASRSGWSEELIARRDELLATRAAILERIRFSDPRWRSLSAPAAFDLAKILDRLSERRQAALTLFWRPPEVMVVLLKNRRCQIDAVPLSADTVAALTAYRQNLQAVEPNRQHFDPAAVPMLAADRLVPAELLAEALDAESLLVVPHGPLHLLPWAGLIFTGRRLFERCPVGMLPNLTCALTLEMLPDPAPRVALIGAPDYGQRHDLPALPYAEAELQAIADIHRSHAGLIADIKKGPNASEKSFRTLVGVSAKGAILHIACHATFETGEPLNSGLLLADGRLDAAEIARIPLPYQEVILSACSTGYRPTEVQGIALAGDDVLGLPGAFLEAGARSLLVSIPKARDDATLEFMTIYHERRAAGEPPLLSFQTTQQAMLENTLYPPHLWIGFSMYACR